MSVPVSLAWRPSRDTPQPKEVRAPAHGMIRSALLALTLVTAALPATPSVRAQESFAPEAFQALKWRSIGPFRGGRSVAVAGVPGDVMTYYFGGAGGGVWKTMDAGVSWVNVTDGYLKTASVGAIAVAESDPNVVYVGMGEHAVRGVTTSHGDGVYRSTDAGRTWSHLGLEGTRAISRIRVHPADPDLVYVAAQGAPYGPSEERGIYRSRDGGRTWEKVLYVGETAGASDLAMDMTNPRILYAAFWDHLREPWAVRSGGPGSGIWKSTDGGGEWTRLSEGLPELMGKIGIDVSRARPDRVFANVEAEEGGLFRSDDGGATWRHVNDERVLQARSWYYMEVFADPHDAETVYVLNAPVLRSVDGGKTFESVQVPHGDNHDLWINPVQPGVMINANDGGANVSFNGGRTWSTQQNQPTAQFYRVITDRQFPYRVYGGQQDNSTVSIASAAPGGIGWKDWHAVSGCESAYLAFDPSDPVDVFGGCYQGLIDVWNRDTGERKPVMAYPFLGLGTYPRDQRYRFNWNAPIVASPHDPAVIYHAGNVLLKTDDRGQSWTVISPDLTRNDPDRQGAGGGPITNEGAGGENYNTIFSVVESPHEPGTIWAGSDDGLVHLTRDGGRNWTDVTPDDVEESIINSIEVSPHDPATAYVVVTNYKDDDFTPHIFRTRDYGREWRRVVRGIGNDAWVRVVREDPVRPGLLYAGTELGMYVSFDHGDHWQPFQLDLPVVPVTDLTIRDNDLVASTQGRGFWILDDLSPLQQLSEESTSADVHLFAPRDAVLVRWGGGDDPAVGTNPPEGAQIFFSLSETPEELVTVEIFDEGGAAVRTFATDPEDAGNENFTRLEAVEAGLNRVAWDFRRERMTEVPGLFVYGSLQGRTVPPGRYRVRLTVGDDSLTQSLVLLPDPRRTADLAAYQAQEQFLASAASLVDDIHASVNLVRTVRDQVEAVLERADGLDARAEIETAGTSLVEAIDAWESEVVQPEQKTYQDVINFPNRLNAQAIALIASVDGTEPPVIQGARDRLGDLEEEWASRRSALELLLRDRVRAFNDLVVGAGILPLMVPPRPGTVSDGSAGEVGPS